MEKRRKISESSPLNERKIAYEKKSQFHENQLAKR
jgi:hypothetical protein